MREDLKSKLIAIYFVVSVAILFFVCGFWLAMSTPDRTIDRLRAGIDDWIAYPRHNARLVPEKFLAPANTVHTAMTVDRAGPEAFRGQTFITGFFGDKPGMKLLDMDGRVLNEWHVSYTKMWPKPPPEADQQITHDWDSQIHGALLYPNGDVVLNFNYAGLARVDKCSRVIWKLPYSANHSIFEDEEGNLWIPSRRMHQKRVEKFPNVPAPFEEDLILKVSPDGKLLKEISVLDVIFGSQYESLLFANGRHNISIPVPSTGDFTHLNDIEVLSSQMAPAFPLFKAGDVIISLRSLNLLIVLDPNTQRMIWSMVGPFLRHHDPDFLPNGRISLFDNRMDTKRGQTRGGSRILEIDPVTREVVTIYGGRPDQFFYTGRMGDHERLPNGNILIANTETGQTFEVTPQGRVVWSFVNRWDDKSVAWIERALRYPEGYMAPVGAEECR
jgi:hypothetical protein